MARQVSLCDGCTEQAIMENPPPSHLSSVSLVVPASSSDAAVPLKNGMGDFLFGKYDMEEFMYRDDVLEQYTRREMELRCSRKRPKRQASFAECLEFLKIVCCFRF
ncbi:unnamed protein product [Prunus armeniaca]|uniref:Uncharacterized protein n=1 Tax=Prunus armeniaca TaxID=36596 RepID=A0A6J5U4S6_PRUAR|nr:unnamed protein product [Prunus armeniaca]